MDPRDDDGDGDCDGDEDGDVSWHVLSDQHCAEISAYDSSFVLGTTLYIECCYFLHFVDH